MRNIIKWNYVFICICLILLVTFTAAARRRTTSTSTPVTTAAANTNTPTPSNTASANTPTPSNTTGSNTATPTRTPTPSPTAAGNLVDITNLGGTVSAQYTDSPSGEDITKLIDNSTSTKYLTFHASGWVQFQANAMYVVARYTMTSANDAAERDPYSWTLQGSVNGSSWTTLDSRSGEDFPNRFQTREFTFSNSTAYNYYRLNMNNNSGTILQIAEWELWGTMGSAATNTPTPTNTTAANTNTPRPTNTTAANTNTPGPTNTTAANSPTPTPITTPVSGAADELKFTSSIVSETDTAYTAAIRIENPNTSYAWNGSYFCVWTVQFETTSSITQVTSPNGTVTYTKSGNVVAVDLGWQSLFDLGMYVDINVTATKSGSITYPANFKANYVRSEDIIYPQYGSLPASWSKNKSNLSSSDLVANSSNYYSTNAGPLDYKFIVYNPVNATQVRLQQTRTVDYPVNTVEGVRIWIPSKYMAMGVAAVYEWFNINPHYMAALGTKENFSAGVVPPSAGSTVNPVMIDGEQWYWPIVIDHPDGPYQQETGNFLDCVAYFRDWLPPAAVHDDYTHITYQDDPKWISAALSSGISITVTRETLNAVKGIDYVDFMAQAADPWAEFAVVTFAYNRGINAFYAKKIFSTYRATALTTSDICTTFDMGGFASHVPSVRAIIEAMNADTSDIYDAQITWSDMDVFFTQLRKIYARNVPADSEWNAMKADVQRAFNVLAQHWGGNYISYRYDFLTLLRVAREYLPRPHHPRPTGDSWYYCVINAIP